jgi:hypothetical protein
LASKAGAHGLGKRERIGERVLTRLNYIKISALAISNKCLMCLERAAVGIRSDKGLTILCKTTPRNVSRGTTADQTQHAKRASVLGRILTQGVLPFDSDQTLKGHRRGSERIAPEVALLQRSASRARDPSSSCWPIIHSTTIWSSPEQQHRHKHTHRKADANQYRHDLGVLGRHPKAVPGHEPPSGDPPRGDGFFEDLDRSRQPVGGTPWREPTSSATRCCGGNTGRSSRGREIGPESDRRQNEPGRFAKVPCRDLRTLCEPRRSFEGRLPGDHRERS